MNEKDKLYDVCIVGGGYSGLVLAIICARAGLLVSIIEQNKELGRKILSTGNGRCNFTNSKFSKESYNSCSDISFYNYSYMDSISFFNEIGVIEKEDLGFFYPITNQAKTIHDALISACLDLKVEIFTETIARDVEFDKHIKIITSAKDFFAKKLVIATGGIASPKLGATKFGYKMAKKIGHEVTPLAPGLVGVISDSPYLNLLSGVRTIAAVNYKDHTCVGEVQFNKDSISGYPVMNVSRFIGLDEVNNSLDSLYINFFPNMNAYALKHELESRKNKYAKRSLIDGFLGLLNEKCLLTIFASCNINEKKSMHDLSANEIAEFVKASKNFSFNVKSTKGFDNAQVTAGGVSFDNINTATMQSKINHDIYFIGEVLDIDGICGGYNLEWARYSAHQAAKNIVSELNNKRFYD